MLTAGITWALTSLVVTAAPLLAEQRKDFVAAERAFAHGQLSEYRAIATRLTDYPLYPYLRYNRLRRNISAAKATEVEQFLQEYADLPIAPLLRNRWLTELARIRAWPQYEQVYQSTGSVILQCHYYRSLLETEGGETAWRGARDLWLHGKSRPKACDPLFSAWQNSSDFSTELVWQRVQLALTANQTRLAGYLARMLPPAEQTIAEQLVAVHRNPEKVLGCDLWDRSELAGVAAHGVRRLARENAGLALSVWQSRALPAELDPQEQASTVNRLALELSLAGDVNAESFLDTVPVGLLDETASEWRLRWALGAGKWERLLEWYDQLDELPRESTRWRYWRARALQAVGDQATAETIFSELATERDYYGFLAADQTGLPYQFNDQPLAVDAAELQALIDSPAIRRVVELRHFNRETAARREWWATLRGASKERRMAAARLAQQWGWNPLGVLTVASIRSWDDLKLRFPVEHEAIISEQAAVQQLPEELIYGLIRRESIFDVNARSRVGARGLMQLMPATAKRVARSRKERWHSLTDIVRPEVNIRYGSHYLRQMLDRFDGNKTLALAAYNGGPHNVNRWLRRNSGVSADLWTELITYGETREYVQAVLSYAIIYRELTGGTPVRLADLAPVIMARVDSSEPARTHEATKPDQLEIDRCTDSR
ncbi:MAG: transglycosylase SLT domain-containing protein [Immundisolibacteraceae bacterium]|nr:transglycosylase SLT domain-containing protein [Immundisolibacteraceae bacterium]